MIKLNGSMSLSFRFKYYGWEVIKFNQMTKHQQKVTVNPFCAVFPTEVSCSVPNIGAAGSGQVWSQMPLVYIY